MGLDEGVHGAVPDAIANKMARAAWTVMGEQGELSPRRPETSRRAVGRRPVWGGEKTTRAMMIRSRRIGAARVIPPPRANADPQRDPERYLADGDHSSGAGGACTDEIMRRAGELKTSVWRRQENLFPKSIMGSPRAKTQHGRSSSIRFRTADVGKWVMALVLTVPCQRLALIVSAGSRRLRGGLV